VKKNISRKKAWPAKERITRNISLNERTGCWEWQRFLNHGGYGRLVIGSRIDKTRTTILAHRYAWITYVGAIPDGLYVLHKCDNRRCLNPDHLFLGSKLDNARDRDAKGRNRPLIGTDQKAAKLTDEAVIRMRKLRASGISYIRIANMFCVHKKTCMNAIKGLRWKHVPMLPAPPEMEAEDD
jgi:hypothetical protein